MQRLLLCNWGRNKMSQVMLSRERFNLTSIYDINIVGVIVILHRNIIALKFLLQ